MKTHDVIISQMSDEMNPNIKYRAIRCSEEESQRLLNAWKRAEGVKNCSQFIKAAVNAYAGEQIFQ